MVVVKNLHKTIEQLHVLRGIDLTLRDSETLTIVGVSGCGKSVFLRNLMGLMRPDEGSIWLDDVNITELKEREFNEFVRSQMSMVFQRGALWDSMTIRENIDLALNVRKRLSVDERKRLIDESLDMVELGGAGGYYPEELSGGMIKRAAIARAIAARPRYLLYDEPTTGLDPVLSNVVNELLSRLNRDLGVTALVVSHDVHYLHAFSDRVAMICNGKIIVDCAVSEIENQTNEVFQAFMAGNPEPLEGEST